MASTASTVLTALAALPTTKQAQNEAQKNVKSEAPQRVRVYWMGSNTLLTTVDRETVMEPNSSARGVCPCMLSRHIARFFGKKTEADICLTAGFGGDLNVPLLKTRASVVPWNRILPVDSSEFYFSLRNPNDVAIDELLRNEPHLASIIFNSLPDTIQENERVAALAVELSPKIADRLKKTLRNNKAFVLDAVQRNPQVLAYVHPHLQADKDVVMAAIQVDGEVLKYASMDLQHDEQLVLVALVSFLAVLGRVPMTLPYMSTTTFWLKAYAANPRVYKCLKSLPSASKGTHEKVRQLLLLFRMEQTGR